MSKGISTATEYLLGYAESLLRNRRFAALTGAGVSTNAGLPDYRGQGQARRQSPEIGSFLADPVTRQNYWQSTISGWRALRQAKPTSSHSILARLEAIGVCSGVVTQNVDGLHRSAGSKLVLELHGSDDRVFCMSCGASQSRSDFLDMLDGRPEVPSCRCGGVLRPSVTFFGEEVSQPLRQQASELVSSSEALLIIGSSLQVNTGLQIVQRAVDMGLPTVLLCLGLSKGIGLVDLSVQIDSDLGMEFLFNER